MKSNFLKSLAVEEEPAETTATETEENKQALVKAEKTAEEI